MTDIKFCGLTRAEDAALAVELGATYTGVIFAGGPRNLTPARAAEVLAPVDGIATRRVGVFGAMAVSEILAVAAECALDVLQLSAPLSEAEVTQLRSEFRGALWLVVRVAPQSAVVPDVARAHFVRGATAVVLDAAVGRQLGGTGVGLDWAALAPAIVALRRSGRVVLAGGLRPEIVSRAVTLARPDVVDVSSGVESAPGVKDPQRMRAFADAVRALGVE